MRARSRRNPTCSIPSEMISARSNESQKRDGVPFFASVASSAAARPAATHWWTAGGGGLAGGGMRAEQRETIGIDSYRVGLST